MEPDPSFVMVPCTTALRGRYKVHFHDAGEPQDSILEVDCRVHAIGFRDAKVDSAVQRNPTSTPGTWYLITLREHAWRPNPMWVHEDSGDLDLGY